MPPPTLLPCPACGRQVSTTAPTCPNCGHKIREVQTASGLLLAVIIGLAIGLYLLSHL